MDLFTLGKLVKEKFSDAYGHMTDEDVGQRVANRFGSQFPGPPASPGSLARIWQHVSGMDVNGAIPTEQVSASVTFPGISEGAPLQPEGGTENLLVGRPQDFTPLKKPETSALGDFFEGYKESAMPPFELPKQMAELAIQKPEFMQEPFKATVGAWGDVGKAMVQASTDMVQNGVKTMVSGTLANDMEAIRRGTSQVMLGGVPLVGPTIYDDIENIRNGKDVAKTLGQITGMIADPMALAGLAATPAWTNKVIQYARGLGKSEKEIEQLVKNINHQIDLIKSLAEKEDVLDSYPETVGRSTEANAKRVKGAGMGKVWGPVRLNSDDLYRITMDYTAECPKRAVFRSTLKELYKKHGAAALDQDVVAAVALIARKQGEVGPCTYCYVEGPRRKMADSLAKWERIFDGLEEAPLKDQAMVDAFRKAGVTSKDVAAESWLWPEDMDPTQTGKTVKYLDKKGNEKEMSINRFIEQKVAAQVKRLDQYEEYMGQLLDMTPQLVDYLNSRAGLRFFSSSDFQVEHLPDLIQTLNDAQLMRLRTHAYTKVPDFAAIVKDTGMKVQLSVAAHLDNKGRIVEDAKDGMAWAEAKRLRKSSPDLGVVLSAARSDAEIAWGLDQDWIDYILPYHGLDPLQSTMGWQHYSYKEKWIDPKVGAKGVPDDLKHLVNAKGEPVIRSVDYLNLDKGTSNAVAQRRYLDICRRMGVKPIFHDVILPNGKPLIDLKTMRANHPNYIKLKKDFARTDTPFREIDASKVDMRRSVRVTKDWIGRGAPTDAPPNMDIVHEVDRLLKEKKQGKDILGGFAQDPLIQLRIPEE